MGTALMWNITILSALRRSRGDDLTVPEVYDFILALVPAFAFPRSLTKALQLDRENQDCTMRRNTRLGNSSLLAHLCSRDASYRFLGPGIFHCCQKELSDSPNWETLSPFGLHNGGILLELLVMIVEGAALFALIGFMDSGHFLRLPAQPAKLEHGPESTAADDEVRKERRLADNEAARGKFASVAMASRGLEKKYGSTQAVQSLSLALRSGECLGLLGPNGAGKTTGFEMLTALLTPTSGEAYCRELRMSRNPRMWQSSVGYCPQSEGLLEQLTAMEFLRLMASLRGVPVPTVDLIVRSLLRVVGIGEDKAIQPCSSYSSGDKRKLSVAAAILGLPKLVFLDEPVAGVDIMARRKIFQALHAILCQGFSSIVLSSNW
ncbi:ATP-binding cassette sub-family A member 7-like [Amblyomma americanum]